MCINPWLGKIREMEARDKVHIIPKLQRHGKRLIPESEVVKLCLGRYISEMGEGEGILYSHTSYSVFSYRWITATPSPGIPTWLTPAQLKQL